MSLSAEYWNQQYQRNQIGWDMGYPSPPLVDYIDQLENKDLKILVPGAGNAWEVEYLWKKGFKNTMLLDFSKAAIQLFKHRVSDFPTENILEEDFFKHQGKYDLILEQTFFTSLVPDHREDYAFKMHELLQLKGKLAGLVFNHEFPFQGPPFGLAPQKFKDLLSPYFNFLVFQEAYNSIKPRKGREFFLIARRKIN